MLRIAQAVDDLDRILVVSNQDHSGQVGLKNKPLWHKLDLNRPARFVEELQLGDDDILWFDLPDECYGILSYFVGYKLKIISMNMFERKGMQCYEDVRIYPCFETTKKDVKRQPRQVLLSGSDYIIVPDEFFVDEPLKDAGTVIVTMGGADPMGFTKLVLTALAALKRTDLSFKVILPKTMTLEKVVASYILPKYVKIFNFGELNFAEALKTAEYAIINGGLTRYECIAAKTFYIGLSIHKTQFDITAMSSKFGYGENLCIFAEDKIDDLVRYLENVSRTTQQSNLESIPIKLEKGGAYRAYKNAIGAL